MHIVSRTNQRGGGAQIPHQIITHAVGEFVVDPDRGTHWAPDYETILGLSAHYYITPSGVVIQQREDHKKAWHALGNNDGTIGIEWMVKGVHDYGTFLHKIKEDWVTEDQFNAGVELYKQIMGNHSIEINQRHSDVDPRRKKDPGSGFPWEALLNVIGG